MEEWPRFFNFKSVELVRVGASPATITQVTRKKVEYINEAGRQLFVDLEECARIWICLERAGMFPPESETDWGGLADNTPGFSELEVSSGSCVGLRGALDKPPWFQFLNRRRTQFEFKDYETIYAELIGPLGRAEWTTFDAC